MDGIEGERRRKEEWHWVNGVEEEKKSGERATRESVEKRKVKLGKQERKELRQKMVWV